MDRRVAQVVHRMVVERVVLGRLRVVADEVGGLLDLAERLEPGLAHLDRHQPGVLHLALADQLGGAAGGSRAAAPSRAGTTPAAPAARPRSRPGRLAGALGERPDEDVGVDRRADLERAIAVALRAIDEVPVDCAQPRPGLLQARLVQRVQLLVVGAQGRVGDLDPLSGHSEGSRAGAPRGRADAREARRCGPVYSRPGRGRRGPARPTGPRGPSPRVACRHACRLGAMPRLRRRRSPRASSPRASSARRRRRRLRGDRLPAGLSRLPHAPRDGRRGRAIAAAHPEIVRMFSIGESYQGRDLLAAKVSDNVATDEAEPEVLYRRADPRQRADGPRDDARGSCAGSPTATARTPGSRDRDRREIWIVFAVNPDGAGVRLRRGHAPQLAQEPPAERRAPARSAPTSTATTAIAGAAAARAEPVVDHVPRRRAVLRARDAGDARLRRAAGSSAAGSRSGPRSRSTSPAGT